jgi:hypothetical protein
MGRPLWLTAHSLGASIGSTDQRIGCTRKGALILQGVYSCNIAQNFAICLSPLPRNIFHGRLTDRGDVGV